MVYPHTSIDKSLNQPSIVTTYAQKNRYIPKKIYDEYKKKRICKTCGRKLKKGERLVIHHIKPVSEGGTNDYWNLKGLCRRCHDRLHKKEVEKKDEN